MQKKKIIRLILFSVLLCGLSAPSISTEAASNKPALNKKSVILNKGQKKNLMLKKAPKRLSGKQIKWSTSNKDIVTVKKTKAGKAIIKGMAPGKATIKARYRKKTYKCRVTVRDNRKETPINTTEYPGDHNHDNNESPSENTVHTHNWDNGTIITQATCESDGKIIYRCSCKETREEIIPPKGHNYEMHICKNCGQLDPDNQVLCKNIGAEGSTVMCYGYKNASNSEWYDLFIKAEGVDPVLHNTEYRKKDTYHHPDKYTFLSTGIENIKIANVTFLNKMRIDDCKYVFLGCENLQTVNQFENIDTTGITDMEDMFMNCKALTTINVSKMNTSEVTDFSGLFYRCYSLKSLDVSNFKTANATMMDNMFTYCKNLEVLDVSQFDTSKVTQMYYMFHGCESLKSLDVSNFDTSNVTSMFNMFSYCSSLTKLNLSNFHTSKVRHMEYMFNYCPLLEHIYGISSFDTSNVTDMYRMFCWCNSLKSLDVSNFDTSNVTNMSEMFELCESLSALDVSKFDTSNVEDMSGMFSGCRALKELDISRFHTSNVTNMRQMFNSCGSLTSLDISNLDTSRVKDFSYMFSGCSLIKSFDLCNFDTGCALSMQGMFSWCRSLASLNISSFDTKKVNNMDSMFQECNSLTTLDLRSFNTEFIEIADEMFYECNSLQKVFVTKGLWTIVSADYKDMFTNAACQDVIYQ